MDCYLITAHYFVKKKAKLTISRSCGFIEGAFLVLDEIDEQKKQYVSIATPLLVMNNKNWESTVCLKYQKNPDNLKITSIIFISVI